MGTAVHNPGERSQGSYEFALGDELRGERATLGKTLLDIQRDLRIKAAYIAAIEDAKPEVFPNPSFIAGYVRSYARYLGMDPDEVFRRFCQESGFAGAKGAGVSAGAAKAGAKGAKAAPGGFSPDFPLARLEARGMPEISLSAIGSVLVLVGLIGGLGYGGWMVLQSIQRVQFAPVEELPLAVAEMAPLEAPEAAPLDEPALTDLESPVAATALADLYRSQEAEVPILAPRDGPIAALDPDRTGLLARPEPAVGDAVAAAVAAVASEVPAALLAAGAGPHPGQDAVPAAAAAAAPQPLVVVAERAAWIRVYQENGTVIFESILEKGQTYAPPDGIERPLIWAGNSGSVYIRVGDALHGPLGSGTKATRDVVLEPAAITDRYDVVVDVPEVISQAFGVQPAVVEPAVAIQ
jgi:cytoskeleton protein RodZ